MPNNLHPLLQRTLDAQLALARAAHTLLPSAPTPYFAHMRVESRGRVRDVLLGWQTVTDDQVTIVDWQRAPLAAVFFECTPGEPYEISIDGREITGRLVSRALVTFDGGELVEIGPDGGATLVRRHGEWAEAPPRTTAVLAPRPPAARTRSTSPIEVPLDDVQRAAVASPAGEALLVLGEAGSGKTTVALHRVAHLAHLARTTVTTRPFRAAVLVPTEGLRRWTATLLERLGVEHVECALFDRWAAGQARDVFAHIPLRESREGPPAAVRIKRHAALRTVLPALAALPPARDRDDERPRALATRADLLHLFGDRVHMEHVAAASQGAITAPMVRELLEHTHVQYSETSEEAYTHVDDDRLATLDDRPLDEGTPMHDAGSIDAEDYPVLFEIERLRAVARGKRPARPRSYDCIVVDEAQELAPLELALIARARAAGGTLVAAGDAGQQVDPTACFTDWPTTMRDLGAGERHAVTHLETSYRCPPDVTALARGILSARPVEATTPSVVRTRFPTVVHQVTRLIDALRALADADPNATVVVVGRTPESAERWHGWLARGVNAHHAREGDFCFAPGVQVACVQEVKGLEFDYVIVPDASAEAYPTDGESRRALYVAVTRAVHQVWLTTVASWTQVA